jgi:uncharacterized protein YjbI with pentapeptide repeats
MKMRNEKKTLDIISKVFQYFVAMAGLSSALVALIAYLDEIKSRVDDRIVDAWNIVTKESVGNSGKVSALEFLNREVEKEGCIPIINRCVVPKKKRVSLRGINLSVPTHGVGSFLVSVNLAKADLGRADLSNSELQKANLTETDLVGAILDHATLINTNLSKSKLVEARFNNAEMRYAVLNEAVLNRAQMNRACLESLYAEDALFDEASLTESDFSKARLNRSNFVNVDFSNSILVKAELGGANLSNSDFTGANLYQANLEEAKLVGANFSNADLRLIHGLNQEMLSEACGNDMTKLDDGLTIDLCDGSNQLPDLVKRSTSRMPSQSRCR